MSTLFPATRVERVRFATGLRERGHTYREIAQRIGCTESTARSLVTDPDGTAWRPHHARVYVRVDPELLTADALDVGVLAALSLLTPDEREAFVDNAMLGHSFEQMGRRFGISRQTVANSADRARHKLARVLFPDRFSNGAARSNLDGRSAGRAEEVDSSNASTR